MKVIVGCLYHETNTFNPYLTDLDGFIVAEGEDALARLASVPVLQASGVEVIPALFMSALPSGVVKASAYAVFKDTLTQTLQDHPDADGLWLHLHGSMVAEGVASGELDLLQSVRELMGEDFLISVTFDAHANLPPRVLDLANIARGYRTVPHTDQPDTERITAQLLVDAIAEGRRPVIAHRSLPLIICGEKALGKKPPLRDIFSFATELEQRDGILNASMYIGHVWSDSAHTGASVGVVAQDLDSLPAAQAAADELAEFVLAHRDGFDFDARTVSVAEAWVEANATDARPVYISDTGDNTTAGASGRSTEILQHILASGQTSRRTLLAGITAPEAFAKLSALAPGERTSVSLFRDASGQETFEIEVTVGVRGELLGYLNAEDTPVGETILVSVVGTNVDVIILDRGESFISLGHFDRAGVNRDDYDIFVVKQGYLFHQLEADAALALQALSHGDTHLLIKNLDYRNIDRSKQLI